MAAGASTSGPKTLHISYVVQMGFYFCLRSCEYANCTGQHRTVQFRPLLEFVFFVGDQILPDNAPIDHFQYATHIVLALENQKNAIRGDTIYHFRSESPSAFPV